MIDHDMLDSARAAGSPIEEAVALFMLHPETFAESIAAGYENPFAGYFAGRGGVLGEATAGTVSSVFEVFEPNLVRAMWQEGLAVRSATEAADFYWEQVAGFSRRYLAGAEGLDRIARWGRRSSQRRRTWACRCMRAGAPCRWPTTPPRGRCR